MKKNPDVDVLVWVDDDIIITNKNIDFQELIKPYDFSHLLISEDVVWSPFNCGILVVKKHMTILQKFIILENKCPRNYSADYGNKMLWFITEDIVVQMINLLD